MKTNVYESAVIVNAALDDEQIESVISRIKDTILNNGGEIREIENWGRKRLAYMVKKSKIGYYTIFRFNAPSSIVAKLERTYTLDEYILRFLTIQLDPDALEYLEKNKGGSLFDTLKTAEKAEVPADVKEIQIEAKEQSN